MTDRPDTLSFRSLFGLLPPELRELASTYEETNAGAEQMLLDFDAARRTKQDSQPPRKPPSKRSGPKIKEKDEKAEAIWARRAEMYCSTETKRWQATNQVGAVHLP